jgi:ATP-dependent protease ClpP protease subunit
MNKLTFSIINQGGKAEIRLVGHIGSWEANSEKFMNQIDELINAGVQDLDLYINSYGGSVLEANEIINQLRRFKGNKTVQVGAIAASAASYLLPYFHKVKAFKNSQAMLHDPIMRIEATSEADFDSSKALYTNARTTIIDAYAKKLNVKRNKIEDMMAKTTWLSASKGLEIGLFDEIIEDDDSLPSNPQNLVDMYAEQMPTDLANSIESFKNKQTKLNIKMKKLLLALGLPETATEDQAIEVVNSIKANAVKSLSALAVTKGLQTEQIEKLANKDFDTTLEMVTSSKDANTDPSNVGETPNIVDAITKALKGGKPEAVKKLDDYTPAELEDLYVKDLPAYEKLINQ